ncbi:Coenzyme PQQ synthesis protein D (PqqD) [Micromonospora pallida]|uniref:Coenzyme PQQ synthesis protein D (PqqD) n=1 Tax=Micromonospora pallida TaxID=145854 RepID=A0A1C6S7Q8_9ACTN|nr:lasso peptide biosynthesis PqqD family chaperone [Micromonospora pallida]SCL25328.1 Coenzyme PQQ synthesis protein D (PqqD) [Micromonospora pallida]
MSFALRAGLTWAETEYGGVLLDTADGEYWTLNVTGARVLAGLLAGAEPDEVVARLTTEFDGDPADAAGDVPALIAELEAAHLVVRR